MSGSRTNDVVRSAAMAAWAVATMVLAFAIVLLVFELYRRGSSPAEDAVVMPAFAAQSDSFASERGREVEVDLYFGAPHGLALRAEPRLVELANDTIENCRRAFEALAAGPRSESVPVLASNAAVRAMYLMPNGDLIVDLARETDVPALHSATAEVLAVRAIVTTLSQAELRAGATPSVRRVQLLFEGAPLSDRFPEHIGYVSAIEPKSSWIAGTRSRVGDG